MSPVKAPKPLQPTYCCSAHGSYEGYLTNGHRPVRSVPVQGLCWPHSPGQAGVGVRPGPQRCTSNRQQGTTGIHGAGLLVQDGAWPGTGQARRSAAFGGARFGALGFVGPASPSESPTPFETLTPTTLPPFGLPAASCRRWGRSEHSSPDLMCGRSRWCWCPIWAMFWGPGQAVA